MLLAIQKMIVLTILGCFLAIISLYGILNRAFYYKGDKNDT